MINLNIENKLPNSYSWYAITKIILLVIIIGILLSFTSFGLALFLSLFMPVIILVTISILIYTTNISFILKNNQIIIKYSFIIKKSKTIPFNNIQNIDSRRGILSQLFKITKISIWTSSPSQISIKNGKTENKPAQILYLKDEDAEFLKDTALKNI
jgi:uncharacterized membrane protein YdbT with pleckstrin-like domain